MPSCCVWCVCRSGAELIEGRAKVLGKHEVQIDGTDKKFRVSSRAA